jgi:hypothetical protein
MARVYIAGPMAGIPDYNFPVFHAAAKAWRAAGWEVFNPAEEFAGATDLPYRVYVEHDMRALKTCDALALLDGWDGPGARGSVWEREVARTVHRLPIFDADAPFPVGEFEPETILEEAQRLVHGDRGADYGHPMEDCTRTGRLWGAILGLPDIDPRICCLMMAAMKISRECNKHKRDNLTDLAGYSECAAMVAQRQGV